jgi:hypothetical protein
MGMPVNISAPLYAVNLDIFQLPATGYRYTALNSQLLLTPYAGIQP